MIKAFFKKPILKFTFRFAILHTVTYVLFGILFMLISDYFDIFDKDPIVFLPINTKRVIHPCIETAIPAMVFGIALTIIGSIKTPKGSAIK